MDRCLLSATFFLVAFAAMAQTAVMTFNIRYDNPSDGGNRWDLRKDAVVALIEEHEPDILGIQEGLHRQVAYLDDRLLQYEFIGVGRDDGEASGEYCAIFYRKDRFTMMDTRTFWLSETPDNISVGWDASMKRIVTYGAFRDLGSGDTLHFFNAHFDHRGALAREHSARLILNLIQEQRLADQKVAVMGDFNALPDKEPIRILKTELDDSFEISENGHIGPAGTFNGFDADATVERRIDYIFSRNFRVIEHHHIDSRRGNGLYPSDHLPVNAVLK
jgi:endonuclease/exonuclease/phosphatase family metal-dependent hydrolase